MYDSVLILLETSGYRLVQNDGRIVGTYIGSKYKDLDEIRECVRQWALRRSTPAAEQWSNDSVQCAKNLTEVKAREVLQEIYTQTM